MKHNMFTRAFKSLVIPLIFLTLIVSSFVAIYKWNDSLVTGFEITLGYLVILIEGVIINLVTALLKEERPKAIKIFFTILSSIIFLPVFIFGFVLSLFCLIHKKLHRFGPYIVAFGASIATLSIGVFIFSFGNIKNYKKTKRKITGLNHRGSYDYINAALIGSYSNWLVMAGRNLWKKKLFRPFLDLVAMPIYRESENVDLRTGAVNKSISFFRQVIANLILFFEGSRSRDENFLPFKPGAFLISKRADVPIFPIVVVGSDKIRKPGPQDIKSYQNGIDLEDIDLGKLIKDLIKVIFTEGINPGVVINYYMDPIYPEGRDTLDLLDETKSKMEVIYSKIDRMKFPAVQLFLEDIKVFIENLLKKVK